MKILISICFAGIMLSCADPAAAADKPLGRHQRVFKKSLTQEEIVKAGTGTYYLTLPRAYQKDGQRWAVIVFLHGAGGLIEGRGAFAPPRIAGDLEDFPFIVVTPLSGKPRGWSSEFKTGVLKSILDEVIAKYRVDESRIYLTGLSMGGFGTWALALRYPDVFAAIAPICGGGRAAEAAKIKHIPIRVFHCVKDHKISIERSEEMVKALKKVGADVELTKYPLGGYRQNPHDAWTRTYTNPEFYEWLLKHRKGEGGRIITEKLNLEPENKAPWVRSLIRFRRSLFAKFRHFQGFTNIEGKDPESGLRFSLPIRNPFSEQMRASVRWEGSEGSAWTITTDPSQAAIEPGKEVRFRFKAVSKGRGQLFPRPICEVKYAAGKSKGRFRVDLPLDLDAYLQAHRPTLIARLAKTKPIIDGKLEDSLWRCKPDVTDFQASRVDFVPPVRTEGWVGYDQAYYYVAMRCDEPRMDRLKIGPNKRDGELWKGDSVEVLLDTARERKDLRYYSRNRKLKTSYQFVVNPFGTVFDAQVPDRSFNADVKVAAAKDKSSWTVEIAIPWADLKVDPPDENTKMGFVLSRTRYPKDAARATADEKKISPLNLQYPPLNGWNHRKEHYGDLIFGH